MKEDKRTVYSRVKEVLNEYQGKVITRDNLMSLIVIHVGSGESTIANAMRTMAIAGLIKDIGDSRFEVLKHE